MTDFVGHPYSPGRALGFTLHGRFFDLKYHACHMTVGFVYFLVYHFKHGYISSFPTWRACCWNNYSSREPYHAFLWRQQASSCSYTGNSEQYFLCPHITFLGRLCPDFKRQGYMSSLFSMCTAEDEKPVGWGRNTFQMLQPQFQRAKYLHGIWIVQVCNSTGSCSGMVEPNSSRGYCFGVSKQSLNKQTLGKHMCQAQGVLIPPVLHVDFKDQERSFFCRLNCNANIIYNLY